MAAICRYNLSSSFLLYLQIIVIVSSYGPQLSYGEGNVTLPDSMDRSNTGNLSVTHLSEDKEVSVGNDGGSANKTKKSKFIFGIEQTIVDSTLPGQRSDDDFENWDPPYEFQKDLPYYMCGFDKENQPKFSKNLQIVADSCGKTCEELAKLKSQIKNIILHGETCFTWHQKLPFIPLEELMNTVETYTSEFEEMVQFQLDYESPASPRLHPFTSNPYAIEILSKRCIQIYIRILFKNYEEARSTITSTYELIEDCMSEKHFSEDYVEGVLYVVRALEIFCLVDADSEIQTTTTEQKEEEGDDLREKEENELLVMYNNYLCELKSFDDFSVKNQVGVLAVKQFFIGKMSMTSYEMQIQVIQEMIRMDPENCEWHGYFVQMLRFHRKSLNTTEIQHQLYSEEEKEAIQTALKVPGAQFDLKIQISQILYLADGLKNRYWNSNRNFGSGINVEGLGFEHQVFQSAEEVVSFIKTEADNILTINPTSVRANIDIAIIFSSILPLQCRHVDFAKVCIQRALLFKPNSSKASYRLAVLCISNREFGKALKYTKQAYKLNKRNKHALADLLRIYLSDINKNKSHLQSTFDEALNYAFHQKCSKTVSYLLFLKAIWKFLGRRRREAIDLILEAYTKHEETLSYFYQLGMLVNRYHWVRKVQGETILSGFHSILQNEYFRCLKMWKEEPCSDLLARVEKLKLLFDTTGRARQHAATKFNGNVNSVSNSDDNHTEGQKSSGNTFSHGPNSSSRTEPKSKHRRRSDTDTSNGRRRDFRKSEPVGILSSGLSGIDYSWRSSGNQSCSLPKSWNDDNWRHGASPSLAEQSNNWRESRDSGPRSRNSLRSLAPSISTTTNTQSQLQDHYRILGVNQTASKDDIRKAYYRLIKLKQLEKSKDLPRAERLEKLEEIKQINVAWESLEIIARTD